MSAFPYTTTPVPWQRPPIDPQILKQCTRRSDWPALAHCLGTLALLGTSGTAAYLLFATQHWVWMGVALYIHGGLFAFNPQTHEFSHGALFKTKWLNELFKRIFGLVHWTSNSALYRMSHMYHHRYTLHRASEGEEVHPRSETTEQLLASVFQIVNFNGLVNTLYDQLYSLFTPFMSNPRRNAWTRYVFSESTPAARRDVSVTQVTQLAFHLIFALVAILTGHWFLIIVVSLPNFYGGRWYHMWVHDTMHVGRQPETDDFRLCCRTVRLDPFTSFLYWHMEWHAEHHTYAGIPCYNLKRFHQLTREHWDEPQSLLAAWREMNQHSRKLLALEPAKPV